MTNIGVVIVRNQLNYVFLQKFKMAWHLQHATLNKFLIKFTKHSKEYK